MSEFWRRACKGRFDPVINKMNVITSLEKKWNQTKQDLTSFMREYK
jgi:hypothetical protein